ncbi:hypothetical protein DPMN_007127 [Dreissena polymorpha]|uniref:Uncharacterized protein n=1 Tax=Dreissena polymorpha TaxID=45954 RepID=A0A9D4MWR3_DREPO|nr:hypothetical protein DPMN_007127 [Dreissena polymorpha]
MPLTVVNSFWSSGIYPIDSAVITSTHLKTGLTNSQKTESLPSKIAGQPTQKRQGDTKFDALSALRD